MNQIYVRPYRPQDLERLLSWSTQNPAWDPTLHNYQTTFTLCAFSSEGIIAFLPVQQPLMMEALLFNPRSTPVQRALAMKEFTDFLVMQSYQRGSGEIYFPCPRETDAEKTTCNFGYRWGFKQLDMPMYRIRLFDLERPKGKGNGSAT